MSAEKKTSGKDVAAVEPEVETKAAPEETPKVDAPDMAMFPPIIVLLHIVAGLVLNWVAQLSFGHAWGWIGLILLGGAFTVIHMAKSLFEEAETNVIPNMPTTSIVTTGVYKYTRNPMYVGFLLGFAGLAMVADAPLMLLLTVSLFFVLDRKVIEPEEEYLADKFGEDYLSYKESVQRWIPLNAS